MVEWNCGRPTVSAQRPSRVRDGRPEHGGEASDRRNGGVGGGSCLPRGWRRNRAPRYHTPPTMPTAEVAALELAEVRPFVQPTMTSLMSIVMADEPSCGTRRTHHDCVEGGRPSRHRGGVRKGAPYLRCAHARALSRHQGIHGALARHPLHAEHGLQGPGGRAHCGASPI